MVQTTFNTQAKHLAFFIVIGFATILILIYGFNSPKTVEEETEALKPGVAKELKTSKMAIVGGLGALRERDDDVTKIVNAVKPQLEAKTGTKYESIDVLGYKHQVVAGTNYFVKARAKPVGGEPKIAHLRIYQDLQQNIELSAYELDKDEHEEIKYFQ